MPFLEFVDSVIVRNLNADPEAWLLCPGTFEMAFLMAAILERL
jgi:hypothetical protein